MHPILIAAAIRCWFFTASPLPIGDPSTYGPYPEAEACVAKERELLQENATAVADGRSCYEIVDECGCSSTGFNYMPVPALPPSDRLQPSEEALPADCPPAQAQRPSAEDDDDPPNQNSP